MKKLAITLFTSALALSVFAQNKPDTTNISIGEKKILIIDPNPKNDTISVELKDSPKEYKSEVDLTFGLDAGVNLLLNSDGAMGLDSSSNWLDLNHSRSLSWRIQAVRAQFPIYQNYVKIKTGLGFAWNGYGLKNNVRPTIQDSSATYALNIPDSAMSFTKNKFRASYMTIPLLLEFNTNNDEDKAFHISAGVIGGWNMGSLVRQKWQNGDDKADYKHKGDYNVNPFTLDATARIGYGNFTLFAVYGLTPLFEKNKGPEVYPVTVGLQIIPW